MDLDDFRYLGTNITALRLVEPGQSTAGDVFTHWKTAQLPPPAHWPANLQRDPLLQVSCPGHTGPA